jgi:hypothetical protein
MSNRKSIHVTSFNSRTHLGLGTISAQFLYYWDDQMKIVARKRHVGRTRERSILVGKLERDY